MCDLKHAATKRSEGYIMETQTFKHDLKKHFKQGNAFIFSFIIFNMKIN